MTSVPINQTNRYMFYSLNTDDINYANKTLRLCMYVCIYRAHVITPNQFEAELLTGIVIESEQSVCEAVRALHSMGPEVHNVN